MKKLSRVLILVLTAVMAISAAGCTNGGISGNPSIGIIQYVDHVALNSSRDGFIAALKDNGYEDGKNITIDVQNAQGTMMVTHNMRDAIKHGNRLIMMHDGRIILDIRGEEKQKLTVEDLLQRFGKASGQEFAEDRALLS